MSNRATSLVLSLILFLTPLLFWTLTPNFFSTPKQLLFLLFCATLLVAYFLTILKTRHLSLPQGPLTIPLVLFFISITTSLLLNPEGRPEALAGNGLILLLLPLAALLLKTAPLPSLTSLTPAFLASTALLSLHALLSLTFLSKLSFLPTFMQSQSFTPTGSYVATLIILALGAALNLTQLSTTKGRPRLLSLAHLTLTTIASVAIISLMLPGGSLALTLVPYQASWGIALDALKSLRSLLFGIGLSNYSLLYTAVKPLSLNLTPLWNLVPTSSGSEFLTLLATAGVVPTTLLTYTAFRALFRAAHTPLLLPLAASLLLFLLAPASLTHYLLLFLFFALVDHTPPRELPLKGKTPLFLGLAGTLATLILTLLSLRPFAAEYYIRQSQLALSRNDSQALYDHHRLALRLYPRLASYHASFANLNLNLASALSQQPNLSDEDRTNVAKLIQASIQSGKTATALRPNDSSAWLTLASIYQNLINVAQGADQFTLEAYAQAVSLDRANPTLRIQFGGLLLQLAQKETDPQKQAAYFSRAQTEMQTAIQLKTDYSNAYYNYAKLSEAMRNYAQAVATMQQALKYLEPNSPDHARAESELETLKTKLPSPTPTPSPSPATTEPTTLTTPSPLPSPLPGGPIELEPTPNQ